MQGFYQWLMEKFLKSSKFWLAVIGILTTFLADNLGLDPEQVREILMLIMTLILGKAGVDLGKELSNGKKK